MKVELVNGNFKVNGKIVDMIIFSDNTTMRFPIEDDNELVIESSVSENTSAIFGNRNTVVQGKNIVHGSVINCKGDFRLGDG